MNKIIIDKEEIVLEKIDNKLDVKYEIRNNPFGITKVVINVLKNCSLEIDYLMDNSKYDILFNIEPKVKFNLYEYKKGDKAKIQYTFNTSDNSNVNIYKFNNILNIKEMIIANLNGINSSIDYNFKSIATTKEVYDIVVSHNSKNTSSNIINNSLCTKDGKVYIQVSGYVDNGITGCELNQSNQIINLTDNKCEIRPNLYINEYDTIANHSALIGGFDNDELFYLQTRGISELEARKLLINGFLLSNIENKNMIKIIENNIKEYWR